MLRTENMYNTNQLKTMFFNTVPSIVILWSTWKPHGVRGLSKHHHLRLDPKLGYGKCAIRRISCVWIYCINMLDKPWFIDSEPTRKTHHQPVEYCTYWPVLGSFNNWKMIQFTNKTTTNEDFDVVHKVVLYGINENMSAFIQNGNMVLQILQIQPKWAIMLSKSYQDHIRYKRTKQLTRKS